MTCQQFEERLPAWLAEEVEALEAADLEAHAARCPACASALAATREAVAGLGRLEVLVPRPSLAPLVMARVAAERPSWQAPAREARQRPPWLRFFPVLALSGALALALLSLLGPFGRGPSGLPPATLVAAYELSVDDGTAQVLGATPRTVSPGALAPVCVGDRVSLGAGGAATLRSPACGSVVLAPDTELVVGAGGVELLRGSATFDLALAGRSYDVATPAGVVHVTGTRFVVAVAGDRAVSVRVERGRVEFLAAGLALPVRGGEALVAEPGQPPRLLTGEAAAAVAPGRARLTREVDGPAGRPVPVTSATSLERVFDGR